MEGDLLIGLRKWTQKPGMMMAAWCTTRTTRAPGGLKTNDGEPGGEWVQEEAGEATPRELAKERANGMSRRGAKARAPRAAKERRRAPTFTCALQSQRRGQT